MLVKLLREFLPTKLLLFKLSQPDSQESEFLTSQDFQGVLLSFKLEFPFLFKVHYHLLLLPFNRHQQTPQNPCSKPPKTSAFPLPYRARPAHVPHSSCPVPPLPSSPCSPVPRPPIRSCLPYRSPPSSPCCALPRVCIRSCRTSRDSPGPSRAVPPATPAVPSHFSTGFQSPSSSQFRDSHPGSYHVVSEPTLNQRLSKNSNPNLIVSFFERTLGLHAW